MCVCVSFETDNGNISSILWVTLFIKFQRAGTMDSFNIVTWKMIFFNSKDGYALQLINIREIIKKGTHNVDDLLQRDAELDFQSVALVGDWSLQSVVIRQQVVKKPLLVFAAETFCNQKQQSLSYDSSWIPNFFLFPHPVTFLIHL